MDTPLPIAARAADIAPFHVMEVQTAARALEAAGRDIVHLEIGEPDFPTPAPVLAAARAALASGDLRYTSALGLPELRRAIARHYRERHGVDVAPERVVVTAGSSAALLLVMALLVERDGEVMMADPSYPCNRNIVRVVEGRALAVPVGADTRYQLDADRVQRAWTPRTRAVLLASPSNPTGTTIAAGELAAIAGTVADRGAALVVDEIYLGLSYGDRPRSALDVAAAHADHLFVVSSFSKYFNLTGWRLGWIVAPERFVRDLEKLAQNLYICPATLSQRAALACFDPATLAILEARRQAFEVSRPRAARPGLRDPGDPHRRLLRLRRQPPPCRGQPALLPRSARGLRRRHHAGHRLRRPPGGRARPLCLHDRRRAAGGGGRAAGPVARRVAAPSVGYRL